jgi:hypothetical protein
VSQDNSFRAVLAAWDNMDKNFLLDHLQTALLRLGQQTKQSAVEYNNKEEEEKEGKDGDDHQHEVPLSADDFSTQLEALQLLLFGEVLRSWMQRHTPNAWSLLQNVEIPLQVISRLVGLGFTP